MLYCTVTSIFSSSSYIKKMACLILKYIYVHRLFKPYLILLFWLFITFSCEQKGLVHQIVANKVCIFYVTDLSDLVKCTYLYISFFFSTILSKNINVDPSLKHVTSKVWNIFTIRLSLFHGIWGGRSLQETATNVKICRLPWLFTKQMWPLYICRDEGRWERRNPTRIPIVVKFSRNFQIVLYVGLPMERLYVIDADFNGSSSVHSLYMELDHNPILTDAHWRQYKRQHHSRGEEKQTVIVSESRRLVHQH